MNTDSKEEFRKAYNETHRDEKKYRQENTNRSKLLSKKDRIVRELIISTEVRTVVEPLTNPDYPVYSIEVPYGIYFTNNLASRESDKLLMFRFSDGKTVDSEYCEYTLSDSGYWEDSLDQTIHELLENNIPLTSITIREYSSELGLLDSLIRLCNKY